MVQIATLSDPSAVVSPTQITFSVTSTSTDGYQYGAAYYVDPSPSGADIKAGTGADFTYAAAAVSSPSFVCSGLSLGQSLTCYWVQSEDIPLSLVPPVISNISHGTPGETTATIMWTTDEPATSSVEYGLTAGLGSTEPATPDATLRTSHSVTLTGLSPDTLYYYDVTSVDADGNSTTESGSPLTTESTVTNLIANGDFSSGTTGWVKATSNGTMTVNGSGQLVLTAIGGGTDAPGAGHLVTGGFEVGKTYTVSFDVISSDLITQVRCGGRASTPGANVGEDICASGDAVIGANSFQYTPATAYTWLVVGGRNDVTEVIFDNIVVSENP